MVESIEIRQAPRCLQEKIGSCNGCGVQEIVLTKRQEIDTSSERMLVEKVRQTLCPEGNRLQVPYRPRRVISW